MIYAVLHADIINGRRASRSVGAASVPRHVVGRLTAQPGTLLDPTLTVKLSLYDLQPHGDVKLASSVWNGGQPNPPEVHWTGLALELCLVVETSQPVSAGAEIEF